LAFYKLEDTDYHDADGGEKGLSGRRQRLAVGRGQRSGSVHFNKKVRQKKGT